MARAGGRRAVGNGTDAVSQDIETLCFAAIVRSICQRIAVDYNEFWIDEINKQGKIRRVTS